MPNGRDVCVNFIKTIFQILRNDVIDNINKFNLATVFASIKCLNTKNRTSNFFQITCPGTSSTFQYFHTPGTHLAKWPNEPKFGRIKEASMEGPL